MRCINCMKLDHTRKWCHSEKVCANCSGLERVEPCLTTKCVSCGEGHHTLDKECPLYKEEWEIQRIRTEKKIPYAAAKQIRREECPIILRVYTFNDRTYAQQTTTIQNNSEKKNLNQKKQPTDINDNNKTENITNNNRKDNQTEKNRYNRNESSNRKSESSNQDM